MWNYERILWPRASFWFLAAVLAGLVAAQVALVGNGRSFSPLEVILFSGFQLVVTLAMGWKLAVASSCQENDAGRQRYMARTLGRLQEVKRSVERMQVLIATKRRHLDDHQARALTPALLQEYFEHIMSLSEEIRGSLIAAVEGFSSQDDRTVQQQQILSQLEADLADLKNHLQQERVVRVASSGDDRSRLAELYEQERVRLQTHLDSLQEFFAMNTPGEPLAQRLLRSGLLSKGKLHRNGEVAQRRASYS